MLGTAHKSAIKAPSGSKKYNLEFPDIKKMESESVENRPELEHLDYFRLSYEELERIDDAESMLERGFRLTYAIDVLSDADKGMRLIEEAERLGHPVARDLRKMLSSFGPSRSTVSCIESVSRGHHIGTVPLTF